MAVKKILIAVDDSDISARAARVGTELARSVKAKIGFIHIFDPTTGPGTIWGVPANHLTELSERTAKDLLATFRKRNAQRSGVTEFLRSGKPAHQIIEVAKGWPADLIVMGSHGRGKIGGMILGSVSQEVLCHAPCPVMVVPPDTREF